MISRPSCEKISAYQSFIDLEAVEDDPRCPDLAHDIIKMEKTFI